MWLCNKEKVKLTKFTYLPDPRNGFEYVQIRAAFNDGDMADCRTWKNDAMTTEQAVKALVVLTAWMIDNQFGIIPMITIRPTAEGYNAHIYYKKNPYDNTQSIILDILSLPACVADAINIITAELQNNYGYVDYLDV